MLFLDEIGELGADEQAMLLRALEDKRFLPVGSDKEVESDFQLIAGTNRDLQARGGARALPRGPAGAHQPVDLPAAGAARAARGHRAEPRSTSWTRPRRRWRLRVTINKEAQEHFLRFATSPEAALDAATSAT